MADTTPKGFRYPENSDAPNIAVDIENLATDVDTELDDYLTSALAASTYQPNVITTEGDLVVGDGSGDPDRLPIGAAGTVLTSDGDTAEWVAPAAGNGMTLLSTTAITAVSSISITSIDQTYNELVIVIANAATSATSAVLRLTANTTASGLLYSSGFTAVSVLDSNRVANNIKLNSGATNPIGQTANVNNITGVIRIPRYTDVTPVKIMSYSLAYLNETGALSVIFGAGATSEAAAIQSLQFFPESGNWTAQGNIHIYGVK